MLKRIFLVIPLVVALILLSSCCGESPSVPHGGSRVAAAHADKTHLSPGEEVCFYDDSTDPDGSSDIVKREWDFSYVLPEGFKPESEDANPCTTYSTPGTYYVQLRVTDQAGNSDMLDTPLEIVVKMPPGNLIWAKRAGGTEWEVGYGITTLSDNSVVVTGSFAYLSSNGSATFGEGEPNETTLTSAGDWEIFIARYFD